VTPSGKTPSGTATVVTAGLRHSNQGDTYMRILKHILLLLLRLFLRAAIGQAWREAWEWLQS